MTFSTKHKNDILLILAVLVLAGGFWLFRTVTREEGACAEVTVDGELLMTLPLSEDTSVVLGEGAHTNTLVIENGTACVSAASCPDHVCMDRGAVRYDGETIVCLPNKLVVTIVGGERSGLDAVAR